MGETRFTPTQRALLGFAALLFFLRFLWLGDTVFILDEPLMQLHIDESFATGVLPLIHDRGSSIPIPYGPSPVWFLMLPRLVFWQPAALALYGLLFQILGYLAFARVIRKAYGQDALAWTLALVAASPQLFFFSRHVWDAVLFVPIGGFILYCLQRLEEDGPELSLHAALGLVAGFALGTHLMFGPVALALGATLVLRCLRRYQLSNPRSWILLAAFAVGAAVVLIPYAVGALQVMAEERPLEHVRVSHRWGDGRNLWWIFLGTTTFSSLFHARAMLDEVRASLYAFAGAPLAFFFRVDLFGWFGKLAAWGAAGAVLVRLARLRFDDELLRIFAALSFLCLLVTFQYLNIPLATHYFLPIWWFVFLGIAFAVARAKGVARKVLLTSLAACLIVNAAYDGCALAFIHQNRGARSMENSVAIAEQERAMRELCAQARGRGVLAPRLYLDAVLAGPAVIYLAHHIPECAGLNVTIANELGQADFRVHHPAEPATSAALVAEPTAP